MKKLYLIITLLISALITEAQVNAGPDSTICSGQIIQLQGSGPSNYEYIWTSTPLDPTISDPTILNPTVQPSNTTIYKLEGSELDETELVDNGDFEQGNTGFYSDYPYCDEAGCLFTSPPTGEYAIGNNPNYFNSNFSACSEPSGGSGNMMICNGDEYLNNTLYETTVNNITPYGDYELSVWITSLVMAVPPFIPQFVFEINGEPVGTHAANSTACNWSQFSTSWYAGSATSATIRIVNTSAFPSGIGNDFALDDVSLKAILKESDYCVVTVAAESTTDFDIQSSSCIGDTVTITYTGNSTSSNGYIWDFGPDAVIISGANQGPYDVKWITSGTKTVSLWINNGCSSDTTYHDINISGGPDIDVTADATSIPYGTSTILHGIISSGNNPQFQWTPAAMLVNPASQDPETILLDQTTKYYFNVTDETSNCSSLDSITIIVDGGPLAIVSLTALNDTICTGNDTELSLLVTGGSENYTATWTSNPPGFTHTGPEMIINVSPTENTEYMVTVSDGFNSVSSSIEILVLPLAEIMDQPESVSTIAGTVALFSVQATHIISYQWQISVDGGNNWTDLSDGNEYSGSNTSVLTINPVNNTMDGNLFRCLMVSECNNPISNEVTLQVTETPNFISTLGDDEVCEGDSLLIGCNIENFIQLVEFTLVIEYDNSIVEYLMLSNVADEINNNISVQDLGGTMNITWSSSSGITLTNGKVFDIVFIGILDGTSYINWNSQLTSITNEAGIQPTMMLSDGEAKINPMAIPVTEIISDHDTVNFIDEIPVVLTAQGGSGDNLIWSSLSCDGDTIGNGDQIEIMRPEVTTTYFAYWTNQCGNSTCAEKEIVIIYDYNVGIPNAFTANNDGLNDEFKIVTVAPLTDFLMQIFNRNGLLIFESTDQNNGWDGSYKGQYLPMGAYVWKISYTAPGIGIVSRTGTVTLIR